MTLHHPDDAGNEEQRSGSRTPKPAVILLTGAGDTDASWMPVRRRLEPTILVRTYRRTGVAPGATPRSLDAYLRELHTIVSDEGAPVVLVGHSFGGLLAQVYAEHHPERIAGLVLVDATPRAVAHARAARAGFAASAASASLLRLIAPLGGIRLLLRLRAMPLYPEQRLFEADATPEEVRAWREDVQRLMRESAAAELRSVLPAVGDAAVLDAEVSALHGVPVHLLMSSAYGSEWLRMQSDIAARYPEGRHDYIGDKHHNIAMAHPDRVADAISGVVAEARRAA